MITTQEIKGFVSNILPEVIKVRRYFHSYPELSGTEVETSRFIAEYLHGLQISVKTGVGGHGVVGTLKYGEGGNIVALRAEMDALALEERTYADYTSQNPGIMHACGHDVHMAILIGVAKLLNELLPAKKNTHTIKGGVKFIFQPSEENLEGAAAMIKAGVLDDPPVSVIFGLHVSPEIPAGNIGIKYGVMMASSNMISIVIKGKTAHVARPQEGIDTIQVTGIALCMLNQLVSREINPLEPAVLSFGTIKGGTARNVLADKVQIEGTLRTLSYETQAIILRRIHKIFEGLAKAYEIEYEIKHKEGSPPLRNNPAETQFIEEIGDEVLGSECIEYLRYPTMGGEDFALYIQKVPGMFFRLGTANPMINADWELHSNSFDVDEKAITVGIEILTAATLRKLGCF